MFTDVPAAGAFCPWIQELARIGGDRGVVAETRVLGDHSILVRVTGFKGNYCPLADTIRSFDELCEGKWDHLPDQAFMYLGAIEEAAERAEKMDAA